MRIFFSLAALKKKVKNPVVAIGVFDGLHCGHRKLIDKAKKRAKAIKGQVIIMTFFPHPVHVLRPEIYAPLIVSLSHRLRLMEQLGVELCLIVRFTKKFAQLQADAFIDRYLVKGIGAKEVVVGDDFRFGKDRKGGLENFRKAKQQNKFDYHIVSTSHKRKGKVGSSQIRSLIADGQLAKTKKLLGRPVSVLGQVVHGDSRGETLGYPTANISPNNEVIPPSGVYIVNVFYKNKCYRGLANVGRRPSFKRINKVNIEIHIFKFRKNLYGKEILVQFLRKIRDEKTFQSKDELVRQIQKDEKKAINWFEKK